MPLFQADSRCPGRSSQHISGQSSTGIARPLRPQLLNRIDDLAVLALEAGLSATTVAHIHVILGGLLKHAKRRGIISRNVLEMVDPPKVPKYEARPLNIIGAKQLLEAVRGHRYGSFWTFLLGTGTRFGEADGLKWQDVDLEAGGVVIRRAVVRIRENGRVWLELAPTKTAAGKRTIPLAPWVLEAIRAQRARVAELRLAAGPVWDDHDLVFPSSVGTPLPRAARTGRLEGPRQDWGPSRRRPHARS